MEGKALVLETKGYCLSCLKKASPGGESGEASIQNAFDVLDLNTEKVINDVLPSLVSTTDLKGKLCSPCEQLLANMKEVKLEMERLEKKFDGYLNSFHVKVVEAEDAGFKKEMNASPNTTVHLGIVRQLRKELLSKCRALAKQESVPEALTASTSASGSEVPASQTASQNSNSPPIVVSPLNGISIKNENEGNNVTKSSEKKRKTGGIFPQMLPPHPTFMLSSLSQKDKKEAEGIITLLGGNVSPSPYFDLSCNALITENLLRSEKVMGCMAKGTFILRMDYLKKCRKEGKFLPIQEEFIWKEDNTENEIQKGYARIAFDWIRAILADEKKKPMFGMKLFLHESNGEMSNAAYRRLFVAGGGQLVESMEEATVVCAENVELEVPDGVALFKPLYFNKLIRNGPR